MNGEIKGKGKEYDTYDNKLKFEGEYLNGKKTEKERFIIIMAGSYLKVNIKMEKRMEKEKNIIQMNNYYLKVII